KLDADGISVGCLNGDMRQRERTRALADFKAGNVNVFVVTDIAARGINVKDISLVVNFDVPDDPESYIHRIGRTGRAGAKGKAIMFVSQKEKLSLNNIERRNRITIKQVDDKGEEVTRYEGSTLYQGLGRRNKTGYGRAKRSFGNSSKTSFGNKPKFGNSKPFEGSSRLSFGNKSNFSSNSESSDFGYGKSRPSYGKTFKKQNSGSNDDKKGFLDSDKSKNSRPSFGNKSKFGEPKKFQKSDGTLKNRPKGNFKSFKKTKNFSDNKNFGSKKGVFKK
ncbi:DEAD/DEAH box helicase, partial [Candidatus Gracilibacteria bacterium]|nr:DEAD/DEAH box helicase [Candidatus Gracilibacteria bacterium]